MEISFISRRHLGHRSAADEVDLALAGKNQFRDMRAVALITVGLPIQAIALGRRMKKRQQLWIIQEEIDLMAFAMIDLEHQGHLVAEGPVKGASCGLGLRDDVHRQIEQPPLAGSYHARDISEREEANTLSSRRIGPRSSAPYLDQAS